jgi:HJR/Mrr/RecB family endonuclease
MALQIATDPSILNQVEWRDLERIMAEVFEALGFRTTPTRGAKDGGKDIILESRHDGSRRMIYVEIKHWCSTKKVGCRPLREFSEVIMRDQVSGLLF